MMLTKKAESKLKLENKELKKQTVNLIKQVGELSKRPINLFNDSDFEYLLNVWKNRNQYMAEHPDFTGGEEYYMGAVAGIDYALFILGRTGN